MVSLVEWFNKEVIAIRWLILLVYEIQNCRLEHSFRITPIENMLLHP